MYSCTDMCTQLRFKICIFVLKFPYGGNVMSVTLSMLWPHLAELVFFYLGLRHAGFRLFVASMYGETKPVSVS